MLTIKLIIRRLIRQRNISTLKLVSLLIGFTVSFMIFLYIAYQYSYDDFHKDGGRMYRIGCVWVDNGSEDDSYIIKAPIAEALKKHLPEIEEYALIRPPRTKVFNYNKNLYYESTIYADSSFFKFFSFPILKKSTNKELQEAYTAFISESLAKKIFGEQEAIGNIIYDSNNKAHQIKGVFKDIPSNCHLTFDIVLAFETIRIEKNFYLGWDGGDSFMGYVKTMPNINPKSINKKIPTVVNKYYDTSEDEKEGSFENYYLQKISKLNIQFNPYKKVLIWILNAVGIIIFIISIFNYILLSISTFQQQIKSLSIQKNLGANKKTIRKGIYLEHLFFILTALLLCIFTIPYFTQFVNHYLNWEIEFKLNTRSIFIGFGIISSILLIAIGLPLLKLKSYQYNLTINKKESKKESKSKKFLLTVQMLGILFLLSILLIIIKQTNHVDKMDLGYQSKNIAYIHLIGEETKKKGPAIYHELQKQSYIKNITYSSITPLQYPGGVGFQNPNNLEKSYVARPIWCNSTFFETNGMRIIKGQDFTEISENNSSSIIVNERLVKLMKWDQPIGKTLRTYDKNEHTVTGVVKDFVMSSVRANQQAFIFFRFPPNISQFNYITISFTDNLSTSRLKDLQNLLKNLSANVPLELTFYDKLITAKYEIENQLKKAILLFCVISFLLTIISLVGYISHEINIRTKEIGIRKVNGAKTHEILRLLNVDFIIWITIAFTIATPISWFAGKTWLSYYSEQTTLSWWIFALAGIITLGIALLTVSIQSWRAATRNPVESLRYE